MPDRPARRQALLEMKHALRQELQRLVGHLNEGTPALPSPSRVTIQGLASFCFIHQVVGIGAKHENATVTNNGNLNRSFIHK
jgi:hypothetical protein